MKTKAIAKKKENKEKEKDNVNKFNLSVKINAKRFIYY